MAAASTSSEALLGEVMLFDPVSQTNVIINDFTRSFAPIASIQKGAPIEFFVSRSGQLYIDPEQIYLHLTTKLTKADGAVIVGAANGRSLVGPCNNFMHTCWKEVTLMLNNKMITDPSNMYPYRAYLETILNNPKDVQETRLITEGFVKDKHTTIATNTPATADSGLAARSDLMKDGSINEFYGRLHLDILQQGKLLPPGLDISLKLIPSDDKFALMSSEDNAAYKYEIVSA